MKINRLIFALVTLLLALTACTGGNQSPFTFEKAPLEKGDLTAYVVANGTINPTRTVDIQWKTSGQVGKLWVGSLDAVLEGQKLAELSESSLPTSILSAQLDLVEAQNALRNLQDSHTNLEQARLDLVQATEDLDKANRKWNSVSGQTRPVADFYIDAARAELSMAEKEVDRAQNTYDHAPDDVDQKALALKMLAAAKQSRDKALANLNYLLGKPSDTEVTRADVEVALAQARLEDAQRSYDRLKNGVPAEDLAAAQARIKIAQATLDQAFITAPFNGIVTQVHILPGDLVQPGSAALVIEDQSHLYVNAQVSEIDVNRIQLNQIVEITLDAVYGQIYHGKVVEIGVSGQNIQGVVNFPIKVDMIDQDEKVRTGMTAVLRIQVEEVKDVLLVPNRAVRVKDGQRVVYIEKGLPIPQPVPVTLGVSSDIMSQVLAGDVKPGDMVILNPDVIPQEGMQ
jgi:HlyD family secretion protein